MFDLIRDKLLNVSLCKQNANERPPNSRQKGWVCLCIPHADYLPVDLFLIIIHVYKLSSLGTGHRTSCIGDEQTGCSSIQEWTWIYSWQKQSIHPRAPVSPLCLPWGQTFMKTFPQNHNHNSITIPSGNCLRHECICCSANTAPLNPNHLYAMDVAKQVEEEFSVCISRGIFGEVLRDSTVYTSLSVRGPPSTNPMESWLAAIRHTDLCPSGPPTPAQNITHAVKDVKTDNRCIHTRRDQYMFKPKLRDFSFV